MSDALKDRFRGCLVGALIGDCLGAPFENGPGLSYQAVIHKLKREMKPDVRMEYTDDTAMTRCIADFLIDHKGARLEKDYIKLAKRFSKEFEHSPDRGYSHNAIPLLRRLGDPDLKDAFELAKEQFDGQGSYGNGGAMRVAPVALCGNTCIDQVIKDAKDSACLTHSHRLGYNGAIVQALAIHKALHTPKDGMDPPSFVKDLLSLIQERVENDQEENKAKRMKLPEDREKLAAEGTLYSDKLRLIETFLEEDPTPKEIVSQLGNSISAPKSVVTAIYSFLRCLTNLDGLEEKNPFKRTILYAISLGGDTDTIASMAGAIAGAYHGIQQVPGEWQTVCEGTETAIEQADKLFAIHEQES